MARMKSYIYLGVPEGRHNIEVRVALQNIATLWGASELFIDSPFELIYVREKAKFRTGIGSASLGMSRRNMHLTHIILAGTARLYFVYMSLPESSHNTWCDLCIGYYS